MRVGISLVCRVSGFVALLAMLLVVGGWPEGAWAQDGSDAANHAGLVVRHGDGRVTYAYVAFEDEELSGIELLRRTGIEAVTIPFGGLGEGVCSLEGEGCGVVDCRRLCQTGGSDSPYWRYFGLDETGVWQAFELGASTAVVRDGDVQLWSWSPDDAGIAPVLLADVARLSGFDPDEFGETHWFATEYPEGMNPEQDHDQPWVTYVAAAGVLVVIGAGAMYAVRRGRTEAAAGDAA